MLKTFDTAGVAAPDRVDFWISAIAQLCGKLHADTMGARSLDGLIECGTVGPLKLCRIAASRHRIGLSAALARKEAHSVVKFVFQERGHSIYEQAGQRITICENEGVAYDVSKPHRITSPSSSRHMVVVVPKEILTGRGMVFNDLASQRFSTTSGVGCLGYELVRSVFTLAPSIVEESEDIAETLLTLLALPFVRPQRGTASYSSEGAVCRRIKSYIHSHFRDPELDVAQIADALGYSKSYLHRCFSGEGRTVMDYVWTKRLEQCRVALQKPAGSRPSITEIAFASGFNSASHFARLFRDHFGIPPSHIYRQ